MFLIAVTQRNIAHHLGPDIQTLTSHSAVITVMTDLFLSKLTKTSYGFSFLVSPFLDTQNANKTVYLKANYKKNSGVLTIQKFSADTGTYFTTTGQGEFFCSSHVSLLRTVGIHIEENKAALPEFFVYGCVAPPRTLYKNIRHLSIYSTLNININKGVCRVTQNGIHMPISLPFEKQKIENLAERTTKLLENSVGNATSQKEQIAPLLSGGLDSSILFKICKNRFGTSASFSTSYPFENPNKNREKSYALQAAEALGSKHQYYESTTHNYLRGVLESIAVAEEPVYHLQSVLLYLLFKSGIPKNKDIVLSGEGADSIFGTSGHDFLFSYDKTGFKKLSTTPFLKSIKFLSKLTGKGQRFVDLFSQLHRQHYPISDSRNILWSKGAWGNLDWTCNYFDIQEWDVFRYRYHTFKPYESESLYNLYTISDRLGGTAITQTLWSKLAEHFKKRHYCPFSDTEILKYAFSIPWHIKLKTPKHILRATAHRLKVPNFIIDRKKADFGITPERWSAKGGIFEPLIPLAEKVFNAQELRRMQYDPNNMRTFDRTKARILWNGLNYALWKRLCINHEPLEKLLGELDSVV